MQLLRTGFPLPLHRRRRGGPVASLVALAMLAMVAFGTAGRALAAGPEITHYTLPNGLEVVIIPDRRAPVVTHMVWYRVGAADETPGKSGLAHFLEHLLFKGTTKFPDATFSNTVASLGGRENAFTAADYTGYFQRVPREHLKLMMEMEADRMTNLILSEAVVKPELNVVLEEQNSRVANNPAARLGEQIGAALYLNHPYGRPIIGWRQEIEALTFTDALAFYKRFYTPNNAILVIAGDVDANELKPLIAETYGKVERQFEVAPRARPMEPDQPSPRRLSLSDPRVTQPSVSRQYLVPSSTTAKPGESEALDLLSHILGGGANSRLYRTLVVNKGLATSAGAYYQGTALDYGSFGVYSAPKDGTSLEQLEAEIDAILADVIANGVTADELQRAKDRLIADAVYAQDDQSMLARWYGAALATGSTVEDVKAWPERVRKVDAAAVQAAAKAFLDIRRSVTGHLLKETPEKQP